MPTRTFYSTKETTVAITDTGVSTGNAITDHSLVGRSSYDWRFRWLVKFDLDFSDVDTITSAVLRVKIPTTTRHVLPGGSIRWKFQRIGTFSATGGHEHGTSDEWRTDAVEDWDSANGMGGGTIYDDTGSPSNPSQGDIVEFDVSGIVNDWFTGSANTGMKVYAFDESTTTDTMEFLSRRGSYEPRIVITYTSPVTVKTFPAANGFTPAYAAVTEGEPNTALFDFDDGAGGYEAAITAYDFKMGYSSGGTDIYSVTNQTSGISGRNVSRDISALSFAGGVPVWMAARAKNSIGVWGPWGYSYFVVKEAPSAPVLISPTSALPLVYIHNLNALAVWSGSEAKPQVQFTYIHPQGYAADRIELLWGGVLETFVGSWASGTTITLNCTTTMARATDTTFKMRVRAVGGQYSAYTVQFNARAQWAQGLYTHAHGAGASAFAFATATLAGGAKARMVTAFRKSDGTPGAWKATVGEVTPSTSMDVLVRLSTTDSTQNPSLPDMTLSWNASAEAAPDAWTVSGGAINVDDSMRRFGKKCIRVVPSGSGALSQLVQGLTPGTRYTWSIYVNTLGATLSGAVTMVVADAGASVVATGSVDDVEKTDNSSAYTDGWQRLTLTFTATTEDMYVRLSWGSAVGEFRVDSAQLEEGPRATQWRPGAAGRAVSLDVGGIQVDAFLGAIFRLRGSTGGIRDLVELGANGLVFGGDTQLYSPTAGGLRMPSLDLPVAAAPANPAASTLRLYAKTGGRLYWRDSAGTETLVGNSDAVVPGFGTPGTAQFEDTPGAGSAATISRSDHRHGMPVVKTVRGTGTSLAAGANASYTISWGSSFADTNYTVCITMWTEGDTTGRVLTFAITSKTVSGVTIRVLNNSAGTAVTPGWHAIGIHD